MWYAAYKNRLNDDGTPGTACTTLYGCCGIGELRMFRYEDVIVPTHTWIALDKFDFGTYTGMFVCTYTKEQEEMGLKVELDKLHTVLYESPYEKNTGPLAGYDGATRGVRVAVYKWGK